MKQYGHDWKAWDNKDGLRVNFPYRPAFRLHHDVEELGALARREKVLTGSSSTILDWDSYNFFNVSVDTNVTFSVINPRANTDFVVLLTKDATATDRTITWPTDWEWDSLPVESLTEASEARLIYVSYFGSVYRAHEITSSANSVGIALTQYAFGAIGDGVTDDSDAISAWLNWGLDNDSLIATSPGAFLLNSVVFVNFAANSPEYLTIEGPGGRACRFLVNNDEGGFHFDVGRKTQLTIKGIVVESVLGGSNAPDYGIWAEGPSASATSKRVVYIDDVSFLPEDTANVDYIFKEAPLKVTGCKRPLVRNVTYEVGDDNVTKGYAMVDFSESYQAKIYDSHFVGRAEFGVVQKVGSAGNEGFRVIGCTFNGQDYPIWYDDDARSPNILLSENHCNALIKGIRIDGMETGVIEKNVVYSNLDEIHYTYDQSAFTVTVTPDNLEACLFRQGDTFTIAASPAPTGGLATGTYTINAFTPWNYTRASNVVTITVPAAADGTQGHNKRAGDVLDVYTVGGGGTVTERWYYVDSVTATTIVFTAAGVNESGTILCNAMRSFTFTAGASATITDGTFRTSSEESSRRMVDIEVANAQAINIQDNAFKTVKATQRIHVNVDSAQSSASAPNLRDITVRNNIFKAKSTVSPIVVGDDGDNVLVEYLPPSDTDSASYPARIVDVSWSANRVVARPADPTLYSFSGSSGNVGAGEDVLATYDVDGALYKAGSGVRVRAYGSTANNANAKTLKMYFGSDVLVTNTMPLSTADDWSIEATILASSQSIQRSVTEFCDETASFKIPYVAAHTFDSTSPITVQVTGTGVSDDDIRLRGFLVEVI